MKHAVAGTKIRKKLSDKGLFSTNFSCNAIINGENTLISASIVAE